VLRQIGYQLGQREDEACRGVVLGHGSVDPRPDSQCIRVDRPGVDDIRAQGGVPVSALGSNVGSLVVGAQIVEAEVVGGSDTRDVAPGIVHRYPPCRCPDDQSDLTLEREQFGSCGPLDRAARGRYGTRRLEEIGRMGRPATALIGS
jgi:hypothetical protein